MSKNETMSSEMRMREYNNVVNEIMRPLSNFDIEKALNHKIKIVLYSDVKKFRTMDEFFYPHDACVILYETDHDVGHWILIMRRYSPKGHPYIEFFDPYGTNLDDTLEYSVNGKFPYLTSLIYKDKINDIRWSNMKLQKLEDNINTCGRWCVFRARNRDLCLDCFQKMVMDDDLYPKLTDYYVYLQTKDV